MTVKQRLLLLLVMVLWQPLALFAAQSDSLTFNQGRTRIWCETARFIYEDNGADSLLASINCQSIETLKSSIASTDGNLGALRLMNSVDKPAIYAGFSSTEARLQKLVSEIVTRLKSSPIRRSNTARLNSVDSLQQQLMLVALQTSAQEDDSYAEEADAAGLNQDEDTQLLENNPADNDATSLPWNEILQWLALLLIGGFAIWRLLDLQAKYDRMKREHRELEKQVNGFFYSNLHSNNDQNQQEGLSEKEVRQVIKEELRQNKSAAAPAVEKAAMPLPPPPTPQAAPKAAEASPAAATQPASANTAPAARENVAPDLYFDKMPFKGGFHQNEMSRERLRDSLYTIEVLPMSGEADYWVTEDAEVQRYAMQNGLSFFEEGCDFTEVDENPVRVVNEQKGILRKEGTVWKIVQKAKVRFE